MSGLFRAEAVQAVHQQWLGRVRIAQPPGLRWSAALTLAVALALAVLLGLASYTRKVVLPGVLASDPAPVSLVPEAPATVLERHVAEGQAVRAGDLLFVLAQDRFAHDDPASRRPVRAGQDASRSPEDVARQQQGPSRARDGTSRADGSGQRRIEVRAAQDGAVHGLSVAPGQDIAPPAALAELRPTGHALRAELLAPGRSLGALQVGQAVRLRLEAYPPARFGVLTGHVERVEPAAPDAAGEPLLRLLVRLDPLPPAWRDRPLAAGLRLQADVQLERRRLWQWLWDPRPGLQPHL